MISSVGFSQEETLSKEAEEIIDELFFGKLFEETKENFIYSSLNYNSNTYSSGRDTSLDQYNLSPQVTYLNIKGFFATLTGIYLREIVPAWDLTVLSGGYYFDIDKLSKNINFSTSYSRYFYSQASDNFINSVAFGGSYFSSNGRFFLNINSNYFFGEESFFQLTTNTSYSFRFTGSRNKEDYIDGTGELIGIGRGEGKDLSLTFNPRISFIISEENINPQYYFYKEFSDSEKTLFGLINTQIKFPIYLETKRLSFEASYNLNFPRDILKKEILPTTGFFALTMGYLISL